MWAMVNGNYERINSGSLAETWDFIAGIPTRYYTMTDASTVNNNALTLWTMLNDAMLKNFVAAFGTGLANPFNLVANHAYTVLGTYNFTDSAGDSHLIVRIRNPWGRDVYNSSLTWRDNDTTSWT